MAWKNIQRGILFEAYAAHETDFPFIVANGFSLKLNIAERFFCVAIANRLVKADSREMEPHIHC